MLTYSTIVFPTKNKYLHQPKKCRAIQFLKPSLRVFPQFDFLQLKATLVISNPIPKWALIFQFKIAKVYKLEVNYEG
jgi:hypothetical protein